MRSRITSILLLSAAMLAGAFGAGEIPLHLNLNQRQFTNFNSLGAGLLLGTALAVIIPEGVHSLYEAGAEEDGHNHPANHAEGAVEQSAVVG